MKTMKFDREKIEEILKLSRAEKWPFPRTFGALKEAGVEYYEVRITRPEIVYFGEGKSFSEVTKREFDVDAIKQALETHRRERSHYEDFLKNIALAGVTHYRVNMSKREVTYCGENPKEEYAEKIP